MVARTGGIPPEKLSALCRLVADGASDVDLTAVTESLLHHWVSHAPLEGRDIFSPLVTRLFNSSAGMGFQESVLETLESADPKRAMELANLLVALSPRPDHWASTISTLVRRLSGPGKWVAALGLSVAGMEDGLIAQHVAGDLATEALKQASADVGGMRVDPGQYKDLYRKARDVSASNHEKGKALEDLTEYFLTCVPGLATFSRNLRTGTEEVDIVIKNQGSGFWRDVGNPFIVECKNLSGPVDAKTIRDFRGKLENKRLGSGLIVTTNRFTRDAKMEMEKAMLLGGIIIISLDVRHLDEIASDHERICEVLESRFYKCRMR